MRVQVEGEPGGAEFSVRRGVDLDVQHGHIRIRIRYIRHQVGEFQRTKLGGTAGSAHGGGVGVVVVDDEIERIVERMDVVGVE